MSIKEVSNIIFGGADHYITSTYGKRDIITTSGGTTSIFHYGVDFGTHNKKIPQYTIEDGKVFAAQRANDGALYVWVVYPRVKYAFLHYHLDKISVKAGQKVSKGTQLGKTGKTGKATGVHLHLGVRDLSGLSDFEIDNMTWARLNRSPYVNPEKIKYSIGTNTKTPDNFFPARGYFIRGDVSPNVGKIASFMRRCFPKYTPESALGNTYGKHLEKAVTDFQIASNIKADGAFGKTTLAELKKYGFKP